MAEALDSVRRPSWARIFGSRVGEDGASDPSAALTALFAVALVLIVGGLVADPLRAQQIGKEAS